MNNKKIYTGALCLEDKKNCSALRAQRPWLTLRQEISCFHYWRKWWLFHRFLLSVASSWVGLYVFVSCILGDPGLAVAGFGRKRFRLFLPPCICEDGRPAVREREREKKATQLFTPSTTTTPLSTQTFFFLCLVEKNYILFCRKAVAGLNKELQNKTLLHLAETDRLRHTEHQLHASESKVERLNSENIKLRLKIDDLRIKLQNRKLSKF